VSRADVFRCMAKHLGPLWIFTAILWPPTIGVASVAAPNPPLLNAGSRAAGSETWILDRRGIPIDTAIVEYWLGAGDAIAWVATRDRLTMVNLGASAKITDAARAFHDSLRAFGTTPASARFKDSARLYALSIQPLEPYIAPFHTLIFAPDGALHYIPFAALGATGPVRPRFLIENHDIAVTPSVRRLLNRAPEAAVVPALRADRLLLVADPVYTADDDRLRSTAASRNTDSKDPDMRSIVFRSSYGASLPRLSNTTRQAAAIAALFASDHVDRLEGFAATKDRFLAAPLDRYRVIHVASHVMTDARILGLSALALSAFDPTGKKIDNLVFAADLKTVRLHADLVVLSASDTALEKDVAAEGLMGLRYIALARGAGAVVASLWEVPDKTTSELMTAFYQSFLRDHKSVTAALSEAMRTMLSRSNADPSAWGSFTAAINSLAG
jgi:CHAT domain-containing protein